MFKNAFHKIEIPKDGIQYYDNELEDDFTTVEPTDRIIDDSYQYEQTTFKEKFLFFLPY